MLEATLKLWHVVFWQGFDCSCASRWLGHPWFSVSLLVYVHLETLIGRRPGWWVGDFSTAHQIKTRLINSWNLKNHLIEKENHLIKKIIINSCLVTHHLPSKQSDGLGCVGTWGRIPFQASGEDYAKFLTCVLLSGPVLVGYTQTLNDWYDKDLDAINEPYRPIPSGRITEERGWYGWIGWLDDDRWFSHDRWKIPQKGEKSKLATF